MALSLELVPRDEDSFSEQLKALSKFRHHFSHLNIPDITRFKLRSWEACAFSRNVIPNSIPHIRAIDFDKHDPAALFSILRKYRFEEILVVKGDVPQDMSRKVFPTSSIDLIRVIKKELPEIKVYAAFDPYRTGIQAEMRYVDEKIEAGCDGFFTQPFFDIRLLDIYSELLCGKKVFWGISPVTSEKSMAYWIATNRAYFPKDFFPSLDWNIQFFKKAKAHCDSQHFDMYLMPIKVSVEKYLSGLFAN